jgi:trigger factor
VKDVKRKELPELDDDFASEASEFDTIDELRADIEHKLEHAQEHTIEDEFREAAVDAAAADADLSLPDDLVTARAEEMWERTERMLAAQGISSETYLQASGRTREEMVDEAREEAGRQLAREAVLEAVADAEDIEVSDDELLEVIERSAERDGTKPEKLLTRLKQSGRDVALRRELRLRKAVDVVAGSATAIEAGTAAAREKMWTPEKERSEQGSAQLWTPGSGAPPEGGTTGS